jgi:hypothetical protein
MCAFVHTGCLIARSLELRFCAAPLWCCRCHGSRFACHSKAHP